MEKEKEVKTFELNLYCDNCNTKMVEVENDNDPDVFTYKCPNCGTFSYSKIQYPLYRYEEV